ncbi:uncharacterized protein LOC134945414 [Pseudophryne corroboree]|uniref:uncharacterized protein LOC134945414 n=1 Tax=Pseudophryne corroboree TaxID=495146 RepID=UPI003081E767
MIGGGPRQLWSRGPADHQQARRGIGRWVPAGRRARRGAPASAWGSRWFQPRLLGKSGDFQRVGVGSVDGGGGIGPIGRIPGRARRSKGVRYAAGVSGSANSTGFPVLGHRPVRTERGREVGMSLHREWFPGPVLCLIFQVIAERLSERWEYFEVSTLEDSQSEQSTASGELGEEEMAEFEEEDVGLATPEDSMSGQSAASGDRAGLEGLALRSVAPTMLTAYRQAWSEWEEFVQGRNSQGSENNAGLRCKGVTKVAVLVERLWGLMMLVQSQLGMWSESHGLDPNGQNLNTGITMLRMQMDP